MDEAQLDRLLARGALQLRLNEAVRWSCGAVLAAALVAAALVVVVRIHPELSSGVLSGLWALVAFVLGAGVLGYIRCRPALREVALRLDRVADLQEHLSTWEEIRRRGLPQEAVARSFALLQRAATLRVAQGLRPGRLMPVMVPGWSRALWLALMLLGCAILMPEQRETFARMSGAVAEDDGIQGAGAGGLKPLVPARLNEPFARIEVLTQADKHKLGIACGSDVPEALKETVLKEIEAKLGGLSAADLSADVSELIADLRRQVRGPEGADPKAGSTSTAGTPPSVSPTGSASETGVNAMTAQQALALARAHFPDVAEALQRYYWVR